MSNQSQEQNAVVRAVCISEEEGTGRKSIVAGTVIENLGLADDAHGDSGTHRQVSLLAMESIQKMREMGLDVSEGDFAENITTEGIDLLSLPLGQKVRIGEAAVLEISQHGKECHTPCAIYHQAGTCVMPTEGIFGKVLSGGPVKSGDKIERIME